LEWQNQNSFIMLNGCLLLQNVAIAFGRVGGRFVTHLSGYWKFDLF